ncbi:hypothetical protein BOTBODRAFT_76568, partial [Botryobasidium botryosum FD-172 SS1]
HCAQDKKHQKEGKRVPNVEKRRDRQKMASFECQSQVTICIADSTPHYADITVRHQQGHVPYCDVSLPEDVKDLIWREIIQNHPSPISFNHKQVYQLWYSLVRTQWTLDVNEVRSAEKLLSKLGKDPTLGSLIFDRVDIEVPDGLSAIAFSVPAMLEKWGVQIQEIALDSAWGTNRGGYEIFALLGEAYGSGLPLGYLLTKTVDKAAPNSKKRVLEQFLAHFRDEHGLNVKFTLSDKDFAEIGACHTVFPRAKHQLCFWHCLKAVKKRLSILRRQPAHYNSAQAKQEFKFIDEQFHAVEAHAASISENRPRRITIRLRGEIVRMIDRGRVDAGAGATCEFQPDNTEESEEMGIGEDGGGTESEPEDDLLRNIEKEIGDCENDTDTEDAPDWEFEDGETRSKDPRYTFCPAPHRADVLRLFANHFCRHPIF